MGDAAVREAPHEVVGRLIREGGYRVSFVRTEVLRIQDPSTMSKKLSGRNPFTALERKALADFFEVPEALFEVPD